MNLPRYWGRALTLSLALVGLWILFAFAAPFASAATAAQAQGENPLLWSTGVFLAWLLSEATLGVIISFVLTRFNLSTNMIRAITTVVLLLGQAAIVLFLPLLPPEVRDQPTLTTVVGLVGMLIAWVTTRASALWQASALMKLPELNSMASSDVARSDPSLDRALRVYRM